MGVGIMSSAASEGGKPPALATTSPTMEGPTNFQLLVSGAAAGAISRSFTAPLDRVKILYQVDPTRKFTVFKAAKSMGVILKNTGVTGIVTHVSNSSMQCTHSNVNICMCNALKVLSIMSGIVLCVIPIPISMSISVCVIGLM